MNYFGAADSQLIGDWWKSFDFTSFLISLLISWGTRYRQCFEM